MREQVQAVSIRGRSPAVLPPHEREGVAAPSEVRRARICGRGPWPVRPGALPAPVRPAQPERPRCTPVRARGRAGRRLLVRRAAAVPAPAAGRRRCVLAGALVAVLSAAAVVGLGLMGEFASGEGASRTPPAAVSARAGETVWDVARRVVPGAPGPEVAALAERIVTDNSLTSVRLQPGQVLRVPPG
jgi:hypothetical protein